MMIFNQQTRYILLSFSLIIIFFPVSTIAQENLRIGFGLGFNASASDPSYAVEQINISLGVLDFDYASAEYPLLQWDANDSFVSGYRVGVNGFIQSKLLRLTETRTQRTWEYSTVSFLGIYGAGVWTYPLIAQWTISTFFGPAIIESTHEYYRENRKIKEDGGNGDLSTPLQKKYDPPNYGVGAIAGLSTAWTFSLGSQITLSYIFLSRVDPVEAEENTMIPGAFQNQLIYSILW